MHSLRYMTSHILALPLRTMEQSKKLKCTLHMLAYLDYLILIAAVSSGLYACWIRTGDMMLVVIGACGLFLFAFCGMLYYYFGLVDISSSFTHLWCGCLLGVISFISINPSQAMETPFTVTMAMLLTSMTIKVFWSLVQRVCGLVTYTSQLLSHVEMFELLGFAVACTLRSKTMYSMWLMVFACAFTLITVRLKTLLALPCLVTFVVISVVSFFNTVNLSFNIFALLCFAVRLFADPFLDLYFCSLSTMERWDVVFSTHRWFRKIFILLILIFEIVFFALAGESTVYHKEWYFAVPAFIIFGFLWVCLHIILVVTSWTFTNKLTECVQVYLGMQGESNKSLGMVMAARGMRYFALISRNLVLTTFVTTLLLGGVSWQDNNAAFMASWLVVLPIESMLHGVLYELGSTLGGTCTGYAVVGPSAFCRTDGSPVLIPASSMEEVNSRSIGLLNTMQRFFLYHMIDVFSCDFSTSGLALATLKTKMRSFFARQLPDGPRFDTYLVYYSGHVQPNGDWALADNDVFKFEALMELWEEASLKDSQSRLILVQDTNGTSGWFKQIARNHHHVLAMQTCILGKSSDPEASQSVGDFTHEWVDCNCSPEQSSGTWKEEGRKIKAVYAVSRPWSEFEFHRPTEEDIEQHWQQGFPRLTHPLIRILRIPSSLDLFSYCFRCWNCLKRWKMKWLPPYVINTGHGFKLVRS
ncbi:transmembrane protein 168-like [Patiria miniata]|uniref:Transmembrane protein 168 n=1 Tax=Patiria miniata TaxID=46514 RepID=A0A913ZS78_PATMI|nr:transmembrane protein 168-like [Patiria miniata]XP_038054488.1 transmembrane protein 168-like [Patiria miniata]XP_038054489.1 transmembrane protein 168-like [Patiria miniata]XP_038054490.1 transmembrane protein 168-like [Patiria miniata]XP_038054491.1 transmembrane protein 168-like [Patiria miniata]